MWKTVLGRSDETMDAPNTWTVVIAKLVGMDWLNKVLEGLKFLELEKFVEFDNPTRMALDEMGNIFVADTGNHRILVLDRDLQIVGQIGTGRRGDTKGRLNSPKGVTVRGGYVWVSDTGNDRVLLYQYVIR